MILKEQLFLSKALVWEAGCKRVHFWNVAAVTKQPALLAAARPNLGEAEPRAHGSAFPGQRVQAGQSGSWHTTCAQPGPSRQSGLWKKWGWGDIALTEDGGTRRGKSEISPVAGAEELWVYAGATISIIWCILLKLRQTANKILN